MKRLLSTLLIVAAVLSPLSSLGAAAPTPVKELSYAYIDTSAPYLTLGEPFTFQVVLPEDPAPYTFEYTFYHNADVTANEDFEAVAYEKDLKGQAEFTVTPKERGKYFLEVRVMDADYRSIKLVSQPLFGYEAAEASDPSTLPGKVAQLTQELAAQNLASDYDKALWLNNWLIYNSDYDESMQEHHPEGVLLKGTGVCESYALAYQMLLQQAGIDSLYVTGYSRGELHAWNLVQLDGEWTYVDTTWNDPKGGGAESCDYFGLPDELLKRDHDWSYSNFIPPAAIGTESNYNAKNGYVSFDSAESLAKVLEDAAAAREPKVSLTYQGTDKYFNINDELKKWVRDNGYRYFVNSWSNLGSDFSSRLELTYLDSEGYLAFDSEEAFKALMEEQMKSKPETIKVNYAGPDPYFMIRSMLDRWLYDNSGAYGVKSYQYNYTDKTAEVTLNY